MRRRRLLATVAGAVTATAAGCGGRSDDTPSPTASETTTAATDTDTDTRAPTVTETTSPTPASTPEETVAVTADPGLPDLLLVNERPEPVNVDLSIERLDGGATIVSRVYLTEDDADEVGLPPGEVRVGVDVDGASASRQFESDDSRTLVARVYPARVTFSTRRR